MTAASHRETSVGKDKCNKVAESHRETSTDDPNRNRAAAVSHRETSVKEKKVFLVSLFTGIAGAAYALEAEGYHIVGMMYAETDPSARQVIRVRYPKAYGLGDVSCLDLSRIKSIMRGYMGKFSSCLVEAGSPCQDLTKLSSKRDGLSGTRSSLFFHVPKVIECVADILKYSTVALGFVEENVQMEPAPRQIISSALGMEPYLIGTEAVSPALRTRHYWSNIPLHIADGESICN